MALSNYVFFLH